MLNVILESQRMADNEAHGVPGLPSGEPAVCQISCNLSFGLNYSCVSVYLQFGMTEKNLKKKRAFYDH